MTILRNAVNSRRSKFPTKHHASFHSECCHRFTMFQSQCRSNPNAFINTKSHLIIVTLNSKLHKTSSKNIPRKLPSLLMIQILIPTPTKSTINQRHSSHSQRAAHSRQCSWSCPWKWPSNGYNRSSSRKWRWNTQSRSYEILKRHHPFTSAKCQTYETLNKSPFTSSLTHQRASNPSDLSPTQPKSKHTQPKMSKTFQPDEYPKQQMLTSAQNDSPSSQTHHTTHHSSHNLPIVKQL